MRRHDIFINYAHLDNKPLYDSRYGWVELLHERLAIRLGQLLGEKPEIWRDPKINGDDYFNEKILDELYQSEILISVISPSYINSQWCLKELQNFHVASGGVRVDNQSRIYKVLKTPVKLEKHPQEISGSTGYQFFEMNETTGHFREFGHDDGPNRDNRYWSKLEDLAQDIKEMIERLRNPQQSTLKLSGKTIYLAETTSDLNESRDGIRRDLELRGHRVFPDRPISHDWRFRDEVSGFVAQSQLSVHLVGSNYGIIPEGESESIVELQRALASERLGASDFSQIIWMPQELRPEERQQKYISELNNLNLPKGAVIQQLKLEDLKTLIHNKLNPPQSQKSNSGNGNGGSALVYIICDKLDYEEVGQVEDYLSNHDFEYISLAGDAEPKSHWSYSQSCDAVLTYCGNANNDWLQTKKMELFKLSGYRQDKPLLAKAFYLTGPQTPEKQRFKVKDGIVIRNFGEFSSASLNPFIEQIKKAKGAGQ